MPNVKVYVDETLLPGCREALSALLHPLRALLCQSLNVEVSACQFAILPALVMADLPRVNVEMHILPHPDRTRDRLTALAQTVQVMIGEAVGTHAAVRIAMLVPEGYVALK
jgi:hypothetical protein